MNNPRQFNWTKRALGLFVTVLMFYLGSANVLADETSGLSVYDETAYTEYVEGMMKKLDKLYIEFSEARGVDAPAAVKAEQEFLDGVHELMQSMNKKFDGLDPKKGASLSETETLVSIHAHTMLIDILAANQMEHLKQHPFIE